MPSNSNSNSNVVQGLISMIDAHLAFQLAQDDTTFHPLSRQSSRGTMFVDFDENTAEPIISYRNAPNHKYSHERSDSRIDSLAPLSPSTSTSAPRTASPPLLTADAHLHVRRHRVYVEGFDPETAFEYDYDGRVVHVHKEVLAYQACQHGYHHHHQRQAHSRHNYNHNHNHRHDQNSNDNCNGSGNTEVSDRRGSTQFRVVEKDLPATPQEKKKRDKVVHFLQRLLYKLGTLGLLNRLKDEKGRERKKRNREHRVDSVVEPVPKIPERWKQNGYHT